MILQVRVKLEFSSAFGERHPPVSFEQRRAMRIIVNIVVAALLWGVSISAAEAQQQRHPALARFIGTWRLVSFQGDYISHVQNRGAHPTGLIYYDATGHMAVQIQPE